jgi:hypothetical protein
MPINIVDNFNLGNNKPIDIRMIVGVDYYYTDKESITHKYPGLRIWDADDSISYLWDGSSWVGDSLVSGGSILLNDGSAAEPTYSFISDVDTGIYRVGNNQIGVSSGGNNKLTIGGNVKINSNIELNLTSQIVGDNIYTFDFSLSNCWDIEMTNDIELDYVNPKVGFYLIQIRQDFVGNRELSFAPNRFLATEPVNIGLNPDEITLIQMCYIGDKMIVISTNTLIPIV